MSQSLSASNIGQSDPRRTALFFDGSPLSSVNQGQDCTNFS